MMVATPDIWDLRRDYSLDHPSEDSEATVREDWAEEFDRAIAAHDAEVRAQALRYAAGYLTSTSGTTLEAAKFLLERAAAESGDSR